MPPKSLKKFCQVSKYIKQVDKELYQAMDDLCLLGLFRPRGRGLTVLLPDKTYRKKIISMSYSDKPETAINMVKALILLDYLPTPKDFDTKKDDIPNVMRKKLKVESADSEVVHLASGHKLKLDTKYKSLKTNDNVVVYELSGKGELPLTGDHSSMKYNPLDANNKSERDSEHTGGGVHGGGDGIEELKKITDLMERFEDIGGDKEALCYKSMLAFLYVYILTGSESESKYPLEIIYDRMCATARATYHSLIGMHLKEDGEELEKSIYMRKVFVHVFPSDEQDFVHDERLFRGWSTDGRGKASYAKSLKSIIEKNSKLQKSIDKKAIVNQLSNVELDQLPAKLNDFYTEHFPNYPRKKYQDLLTIYDFYYARNKYAKYSSAPNDTEKLTFSKEISAYNTYTSFNPTPGFNDIAYNFSMFWFLIHTDAFMYTPSGKKPDGYLDADIYEPNIFETMRAGNKFFSLQFAKDIDILGGSTIMQERINTADEWVRTTS